MSVQFEAVVMNREDNVATAICQLRREEDISLKTGDNVITLRLLEAIPFGHKFALKDITEGEGIIKYGEKVGQSTVKIKRGEHVHIHNVEGLRGRGDKS